MTRRKMGRLFIMSAKDSNSNVTKSSGEDLLSFGVNLVFSAQQEDVKKNYREAAKLYKEAVEVFVRLAEKDGENSPAREFIARKCSGYLRRIEEIKQIIVTEVCPYYHSNC